MTDFVINVIHHFGYQNSLKSSSISSMKYILLIFCLFSFACTTKPTNPSETESIYVSSDVPVMTGKVNDRANVLTDVEISTLEDMLTSLEDSIGTEMVILTVGTLPNMSIEEFSMRVVNQWKVGREHIADGILITLAISDRKVRIEVGYGLELIITDVVAKTIIQTKMMRPFKAEEYGKGLIEGSSSIIQLIQEHKALVGKRSK